METGAGYLDLFDDIKQIPGRTGQPLTVFLGVVAAHFVWSGLFPEVDPAQARWASVSGAGASSWFNTYLKTQGFWMGYSYALSLAFATAALRRYRENRNSSARTLALGGVTFTGFLAVAGCFLVGCCGSPMLVIYISLFGAWFLPLAKPLVAVVTTISIAGAWWWMKRRQPSTDPALTASSCNKGCCCD